MLEKNGEFLSSKTDIHYIVNLSAVVKHVEANI